MDKKSLSKKFPPELMQDMLSWASAATCFTGGYAISVVIFALVGFSYVVGDISSCLTQRPGFRRKFCGKKTSCRTGTPLICPIVFMVWLNNPFGLHIFLLDVLLITGISPGLVKFWLGLNICWDGLKTPRWKMKLGVQCSVPLQVFSTCVCRNYEGNDKDYIWW